MIDAGEPDFPEYIKNLKETMIKYNFQLDHIIVTHWHSDHIGGVNSVLDMITNKNGNTLRFDVFNTHILLQYIYIYKYLCMYIIF